MFKSIRLPFAAFCFAFMSGLISLPEQSAAQQAKPGPVIFAAASMRTALDAISADFTKKTGYAPKISYGSSGVLAKQINQAAPADIFISANLKWMDYLDKAKLLRPGTRRNLLGNALVLIEPADANAKLKIAPGFPLAAALGNGKLAVCTIASCPAGIYGKQALVSLGVFKDVEPKLAQAANVRSALVLVARGEAKFGIVYATDAKAEPKVKVVDTFPESSHKSIVYPIAILKSSTNPEAARFVAFMTSQVAVRILTGQGFTVLEH
ncbi:MAG: molybdate ABC transporter substrate-binding protein [Beijerinckiaceae bacterium]|nr:MAG: molybdate ABC transporter substrate-binding protein [Beijerinckiaceae bacterium]